MFSMDLTPGKVGRVIVSYTLDRITKVNFVSILPVVTTDIFTDFLGFAIFSLIASIYFHYYVLYVIIIDMLLLIPFLFFMNSWLYNKIKRFIKPGSIISKFTIYGDEYFAAQSSLNTPKVYAVSLLVAIPEAFLFVRLLPGPYVLGPIAPIGKTTFIYSVAQLIGMGVPSSIGVTDGALVAFSSAFLGLPILRARLQL